MSESNGESTGDGYHTTRVDNNTIDLDKSSDSIENGGGSTTKKPNRPRRCMFGCTDGSSTLCRFPIHDAQRCQDWVDFFQVSEEQIRKNSLVNLRVCMKHFKEKVTMINGKVTRHPSADSNKSSSRAKRPRQSSTSVRSVDTSSRASSVQSDCTTDSETKSKRNSNESLKKLPLEMMNGGNRKLFVITPSDDNAVPGQKSKMFLILENGDDNDETKKHQKITLIADKSDAQTAEKIEQLLPQLIEKIQSANEAKNSKETVLLIDSDEEMQDDQDFQATADEVEIVEPSNVNIPEELPIKIQRVETLVHQTVKPSTPAEERIINNKSRPNAVNLSPDFVFLMKMVPKLEAIEEPLKTHIKNRIESMLEEPYHEITFEDSYKPNLSPHSNGLST